MSRGVIPPLILGVLALVSMAEPLSINMYLSGMPQLARDLDLSQAGAQLTLTFFLAGMAVGQLAAGPWSDTRGRRGLFLAGSVALAVATVLAAVAPHAWLLFLARFLMGLAGGTAVVLARAVAADLTHGPELARVFSLLMLLGGIAPVIGPVVGGILVDTVGWRGVFWVLAGLNVIVALGVWRTVPETLPRERRTAGGWRPLLTSVRGLLADRAYVSFTTGFIFSFATMFAYVSASPFILQEHYGFTPVQFAMIFAANTTGMFIVALLNARVVKKVGPLLLARIGNIVMLVATVYLLIVALVDAPRWFILAGLFTVVASMGLNFADNSALAISRAGKVAGSASAFLGSGQFLLAGIVSPVVGIVASTGLSQPVAMAAVMVATAVIATVGVHSGARALGRGQVS